MRFEAWDTLLNIVLLLFWYGLWTGRDRRVFFNPFLASMMRISGSVVDYLKKHARPVFAPLSDRVIILLVFAAILVARAFLAPQGSLWVLTLGFYSSLANLGSIPGRIAFSVLSFCIFLFKVWGISLIYVHGVSNHSFDNCSETLFHASRPFSNLRFDWRPIALAFFGMAIVLSLDQAGRPVNEQGGVFANRPALVTITRYFIISLAGWVHVLAILRTILFLLIIGSWVSMFTASQPLMHFCRTWLDFLLGPLRRYPLRIGMLDLTPIVMIIALNALHELIMGILARSYLRLV